MQLKVLTYNVNKSRDFMFRRKAKKSLKQLIQRVDADIVFLQEIFVDSKSKGIALEQFADELWQGFVYGKNSTYEKGHHGNAILSKYPIRDWENINISTNKLEKRGALFARVSILKDEVQQDLHLYCVHLNLLQRGRDRQLEQLEREVNKRSQQVPFIIAGDFNDWNHRIDKAIKKSLGVVECSSLKATGSLVKTFPSYFPILGLDRIYGRGVSPAEEFSYTPLKDVLLSDHLPLVAKVNLSE